MPEAPAAPAAVAPPPATPPPAPSPEQVVSAAAKAPPIHVSPSSISEKPEPPKPGTARERIFKELRKKAGTDTEEDETPSRKTEVSTAEPEAGEEPTAPAVPEKGKAKVNPWKLLEEYKQARAKAETEVAELRKLVPNEKARRDELEKLQKYEARAKELEDEIRYVNYTKSQEFQEQYQQPYEKAWKSAMEDLKELTITDEASGEGRPVQPQDILELVNMPLGKARETANAMFGEFADDVMAHRKEIRSLFEKQAAALEEAKKTGEIRERERKEQFQREATQFQSQIAEAWKRANDEALEHPELGKLFKPEEGDDEGNERLKKGYELVDKAFAENPADPNLTAEQRMAVIKRHAAVRNRAAAFGRLRYQNEKLSKVLAELKEKLKQYEASTPSPSSGNSGVKATLPGSTARASVLEALHKLAK